MTVKKTGKRAKATKTAATERVGRESRGFTDAERVAMAERARELKAEARASRNKADGEDAVLASLAGMPQPGRTLGERLHAIVKANAPGLAPRLWYGMPAYANRNGKVVCFFQAASKFKTRYASFAFTDEANLDDGNLWPVGFALRTLTAAGEAMLADLVTKAVG